MSESKLEEIIAMLWTIFWAILWANGAHPFFLLVVCAKAVFDHTTAILMAIHEIKEKHKSNSQDER